MTGRGGLLVVFAAVVAAVESGWVGLVWLVLAVLAVAVLLAVSPPPPVHPRRRRLAAVIEQPPDLEAEIRAVGWDAWAAGHRLRVLDVAADPGHLGADVTLFEVAAGRWAGTRLVQVIDASPNEAGVHERHGLPVPDWCRSAVEAVALTWGLSPNEYAPQRHT